MGFFQVRYDSIVINYERKLFIRLATGVDGEKSGFVLFQKHIFIFATLWIIFSSK